MVKYWNTDFLPPYIADSQNHLLITPDMSALSLVLIPLSLTDLSSGDLRLMLELTGARLLTSSRLVLRWPRLPLWVFMLWFLFLYSWSWWEARAVRAQSGRLEAPPTSTSPRRRAQPG